MLLIRVKLDIFKINFFQVFPNQTIFDFTCYVSSKYGFSFQNQFLIYQNQILPPELTFSELMKWPNFNLQDEFQFSSSCTKNSTPSHITNSNCFSSVPEHHHVIIPYESISLYSSNFYDPSHNPKSTISNLSHPIQNNPAKNINSKQGNSKSITKSHDSSDFQLGLKKLLQLKICSKSTAETALRLHNNDFNAALAEIRSRIKTLGKQGSIINSKIQKMPDDLKKIYDSFSKEEKQSFKLIIARGHDVESTILIFQTCGCNQQETISLLEN